MSYAAGTGAMEITVRGVLPIGDTTENVTHFIMDTTKSAIVGQVVLPSAVKQSHAVAITVKVPGVGGPHAIGTFDDSGNFRATSYLRIEAPAVSRPGSAERPS